jgi:hypothetical protein
MAGSKIRLYGSTSGYVELEAPAVGDDGVLVLPTAAGGFGPAGIGSNTVGAENTGTFATSSTSFVTVTSVTVSITPTSATSKVFVLANISSIDGGNDSHYGQIYRDGSAVGGEVRVYGSAENSASMMVLNSPATTSATTYDLRVKVSAGSCSFIGCSITAIEVAA